MKYIIGFDMSCTQIGKKGKVDGLTIYTQRVLEELCMANEEMCIIGIYYQNIEFEPSTLNIIQKYKKKILLVPIKSLDDIGEIVKEYCVDIFYSSLPDLRTTYIFDCKKIFSIHGMRAVEIPTDKYEYTYCHSPKQYMVYLYKRFLEKHYVNKRIEVFKHFFQSHNENVQYIINTKHTQFTLMSNIPNLNMDKFTVWTPPLNHYNFDAKLDIFQQYQVEDKKFILIVMASRWEKNAYRAIKAMDRLYSIHKDIKFKTLVTGMTVDKNTLYSRINNREKFIFTHYIPMEHIQTLYKNAYCLLFPSLNEGYGYLPLEAMKYGTPVITSGLSAVPEVCSNAVLYANPFSIIELGSRVYQLLYDSDKYKELQENGLTHYKFIQEQYSSRTLLDLFFQ